MTTADSDLISVLPFLTQPTASTRKTIVGDDQSGRLEITLYDDILESERLAIAQVMDEAQAAINAGRALESETILVRGQALAIIRGRVAPNFAAHGMSSVPESLQRALSDIFRSELEAHRKRAAAMVKAALGDVDPKAKPRG